MDPNRTHRLRKLFAQRLETGVFSTMYEPEARRAAANALASLLVEDLARDDEGEHVRWRPTMDSLARMTSNVVSTAQRRTP